MTSKQQTDTADDQNLLGFTTHDHEMCVRAALLAAEKKCEDEALRFTPVRRIVLEFLLREHRALGAYAILDLLRDAGFGSQPPVAYRALDFLTEHGFAHKIERLNAFIACNHPGPHHAPAFMICRVCETVAETPSKVAQGALDMAAQAAGFKIERTIVEAEGICPVCIDKDSQ